MRQQFVWYHNSDSEYSGDHELWAETQSEVFESCPWAVRVIEVDDGWIAFESVKDAQILSASSLSL